jgi:hypothetical protein
MVTNVDEIEVAIDETVVEEEATQEEAIEKPEASEESEPATIQDEEDDEEDRIVSIGDPEAEAEDEEAKETPGWVKKVRKVNRKLESENKKLKKQLEVNSAPAVQTVELGAKPTLASAKYDDVAYEKQLEAYWDRQRKVDIQAAEQAKTVETQQKTWQGRQDQYVSLKEEHKFKDFTEAEDLVSATFSSTQQGIIVEGAEDAALLVYALGKNPKQLEELAKIKSPVEFAFKVAKLESQLKVTNKKAPSPEKRVSSGKAGGISGNGDKTLERLRAEAEKSGNYTEVTAYKKSKK